jgi:predicted lipid-binding transport protein (Tim44 family)
VTGPAILGELSPAPLGGGSDGVPAVFGIFVFIFLVVFVLSIVFAIYRFSQTRQMAMKKGATEGEATVLAMSGPVGTAAAFVAPNPADHLGQGPASAETRIREVRALQSKGLISPEQAEARIEEILKGI